MQEMKDSEFYKHLEEVMQEVNEEDLLELAELQEEENKFFRGE